MLQNYGKSAHTAGFKWELIQVPIIPRGLFTQSSYKIVKMGKYGKTKFGGKMDGDDIEDNFREELVPKFTFRLR